MGFRAIKDDTELISLNFSFNDWEKLKKDISFKNTLKMTCCDSKAIMKTIKLGLQFFSHHVKKNCNTKPESIDHLMLKKYVYEALIHLGYKADIEKNIYINNTQRRPDILVEINDLKIVFEIQNTKHDLDLIKQRSLDYVNNNMIVVWLNLFDCSGYTLTRFNVNYDNMFVYDIKKIENSYIVDDNLINKRFNLKDFIELKINESFIYHDDLNLDEKFRMLLSYNNEKIYFLNDFTKIDNYIVIPKEKRIYRHKNRESNFTLELKLIKGFSLRTKEISILVQKSALISGMYAYSNQKILDKKEIPEKYFIPNIEPISEYNLEEYRGYFIGKVVYILKNMGWNYVINKTLENRFQIDIFAECNGNKLAFLTLFYSDPDIQKTINFSKENNMQVIVLNFEGNYTYNTATSIDCKKFKGFDNSIEIIIDKYCPF